MSGTHHDATGATALARLLRAALLAAALPALAACAIAESKPTSFYLLDPIDPATERPAGGAVRLAIEEVAIPKYLDRQGLVLRDSANRLRVAGLHQWAEPLDATIMRVLTENLRLLLKQTEVVALPDWRGDYNAELDVQLLRFERQSDGRVVLVASWAVVDSERRRQLLRRRAVVQQAVADAGGITGPDYDAVVAAMNAALGELSRRIADSLRQAGVAA